MFAGREYFSPAIFFKKRKRMKIKIESDVHDIHERLKEIDDGYYLVYDTEKELYELHNSNQQNSFCLTIPFDCVDARIIDMVYVTSIDNIDNIIEDIDTNNSKISMEKESKNKDIADYKIREIYRFASNSSKEIDEKRLIDCGGEWL